MTTRFRQATETDLVAVVALLADDVLGQNREGADIDIYRAAFRDMEAETANWLIVGETAGRIVASYQITVISGISFGGARRAQIEGVRVAVPLRGRGIGAALVADAEHRARAAGATLLQLTMNRARDRTKAFYLRQGFEATHLGFKKPL